MLIKFSRQNILNLETVFQRQTIHTLKKYFSFSILATKVTKVIQTQFFLIIIKQRYQPMEKDLLDISKEELGSILPSKCININVGVLGHVDSGKTSLCRILSQVTSTASLDKNPQSQERGITLDLGFSAFFTRVPTRLQQELKQQYLQFTLVDCPGHASLIRTIIGGAQIIDIMFLIVDASKGIQAQTAECIIIAELFMKKLIVVLNKVDTIEDKKILEGKIAALRKVFSKTKFGENLIIVPFSTRVEQNYHNKHLKEILLDQIAIPERQMDNKFLYLIDHCFKIKGKGTVITGTVVEGRVKPGEEIELCQLQQKCKIKSMEMFRKPVQVARQGDRIAMLMQHLDAQQVERGIACTPGYLRRCRKFVIDLHLVRLYKRPIKNKAKFNIMSGHQTVEGELRLFFNQSKVLSPNESYLAIGEVSEQMIKEAKESSETKIFAILTFQKEFYANVGFKVIGYKPDIDNDEKACRIAFFGTIQKMLDEKDNDQIKLYKKKIKKGVVDRIVDNYSIIVKEMFDKETNLQTFIGKEVLIDKCEQVGRIEGGFGKSGKVKVMFKEGIQGMIIEGAQVVLNFTKWYN